METKDGIAEFQKHLLCNTSVGCHKLFSPNVREKHLSCFIRTFSAKTLKWNSTRMKSVFDCFVLLLNLPTTLSHLRIKTTRGHVFKHASRSNKRFFSAESTIVGDHYSAMITWEYGGKCHGEETALDGSILEVW